MSTTAVAWLLPDSDTGVFDQTNTPSSTQSTSDSSICVPPPPLRSTDNRQHSMPFIPSTTQAVSDVMDVEPTSHHPDLAFLPVDYLPPGLRSVINGQPEQMDVDSDSTRQANGQTNSQQHPDEVGPGAEVSMEQDVALRSASVPVPSSTAVAQSWHQGNVHPPTTSQSSAFGQAQVQEPSTDDEAPDSEDERSVEDEDESDGEYDGDREFLKQMVEDVSAPSEAEIKMMEQTKELLATEHDIWESRVYKALDDPEYQPQVNGRIFWTLEGFHGTVDAPNKQLIMRSPLVDIGGFSFNIKVFLKGMDGTDCMSVYIECTGPSSLTGKESGKSGPEIAAWEVAAQFGCIMYNPQDPRVYKFEQATHHFQNDNSDWGWTRFYGPWRELHQRRLSQRRPMLQKDELAFCVYLRTFDDPTRALWWNSADHCGWNSLRKTGLHAIEGVGPSRQAVAAALVPWLHLIHFQKFLIASHTHLGCEHQYGRPWPMIMSLLRVLEQKTQKESSQSVVSLGMVEKLLVWYRAYLCDSSDVVQIWENLRSILNRELEGRRKTASDDDVLSFIKTYKVKYEPNTPTETPSSSMKRYGSSQEIANHIFSEAQTTYLEWDGHPVNAQDLPPVLQIELPRQHYDENTRTWRRLTHRIRINEMIDVKGTQYHLFGLIVSKGKLGSGRTYAIVRSSSLESQWARYKAGTVMLLTSRQAIRSHEGATSKREGEESVAQVLIYVKAGSGTRQLPCQPQVPGGPIMTPIPPFPEFRPRAAKPLATLPVVVHYANSFVGYQGPGIVDPYQPVLNGVSGTELTSHFNSESTIESVENYLHVMNGSEQRFKCSVLEWQPPPEYTPPRPKICSSMDKLGQVRTTRDRVHLWVRRVAPKLVRLKHPTNYGVPVQLNSKSGELKELFVKVYYPGKGSPMGIFDIVVNRNWKLSDLISSDKLPQGQLIIYTEEADGYHVQPTKMTLETRMSSAEISSSCIITLVSNEHAGELELHYARMRNLQHFAFQGSQLRHGYFNGGYMRADLQAGLVSGYGIQVAKNGDYYEGCFRPAKSQVDGKVVSYRHGAGTMYYANGDTYSGAWYAGNRGGEGKMTYSSTGNMYIGGWRNGHPHGKGTMHYEQADVTVGKCHICYRDETEVKLDTAFFPCGHMLACDACARQCPNCPACRRPVSALLKICDWNAKNGPGMAFA